MTPEIVSYGGWQNCLRLGNDEVELLVTLDVGPRILSYKRRGFPNILKNYTEQLGGMNEKEWMIRGGHRLWIAPEDEKLSYHLDNEPVSWVNGQDDNLTITSRMAAPHPLRKELSIGLTTSGSRVKLRHSITNEGSQPITLATWALTVMAPGGTEIIPQPPLGEHPRDLLPNRTIVLWPYTDLTDSRWKLGCAYFLLQQNKGGKPTKVGLAHDEKWVGYLLGDQIFIKTFDFQRDAAYPDGGCNFETFTNYDMLEIESLGPLATLHPGESTSHDETWHLEAAPPDIDPASEISLTESLRPIISKIL